MQKSRVNWQLEGDKNTKFFHAMASSRQRRNEICSIMVNNTLVEEPKAIKEAVYNYYKNLYEEDWDSRPYFKRRYGQAIDDNMASELVESFSEQEVWNSIKSCDGNKAPGPDGFNTQSIKMGWTFMKKDIMAFMDEFHRNCRLPKCINSSFITLVPKVDNPLELKDYRPISLIGCMYKILAKVLATRIKSTIPTVIGEVQSAFSGGKNIQDGIQIANEVVDFWKKSRNIQDSLCGSNDL